MLLPPGFTLIKNVSNVEMKQIEPIMKIEDLSTWDLNPKDFFIIKNRKEEIVSFGRIHNLEEYKKELSSLRVNPELRWHKLWLYLSEQLISEKKWTDELYLATKTSLWDYYNKIWFEIICIEEAPQRFLKTAEWAKSNNIDFIVMKYMG